MSQIWFNAIRAGDITFVRANATKYRGTRNKHNETGLVYAIKHNRVDIASFLIPYERNLILDGAFTPLMVCALYNCVDVAIILAASGHSAVNSEMQTALMIAAERDHAKIIQIILPNEVMRRDSRDRTALMLASISGQNKAVELLLPRRADLSTRTKKPPFILLFITITYPRQRFSSQWRPIRGVTSLYLLLACVYLTLRPPSIFSI